MRMTAYEKAATAQRNLSSRGFSRAPLGNTLKVNAPRRPPLSAPPRNAPIGALGSPAHLGQTNSPPSFVGMVSGLNPWKLLIGLGMNYAVVYGLIEVFPHYMKARVSARATESEKRAVQRRMSLVTAAIVTGLNSIAIPLLVTKD